MAWSMSGPIMSNPAHRGFARGRVHTDIYPHDQTSGMPFSGELPHVPRHEPLSHCPGQEDAFIAIWRERNSYLEQVPGFIRKLSLAARRQHRGIHAVRLACRWESEDAFPGMDPLGCLPPGTRQCRSTPRAVSGAATSWNCSGFGGIVSLPDQGPFGRPVGARMLGAHRPMSPGSWRVETERRASFLAATRGSPAGWDQKAPAGDFPGYGDFRRCQLPNQAFDLHFHRT